MVSVKSSCRSSCVKLVSQHKDGRTSAVFCRMVDIGDPSLFPRVRASLGRLPSSRVRASISRLIRLLLRAELLAPPCGADRRCLWQERAVGVRRCGAACRCPSFAT